MKKQVIVATTFISLLALSSCIGKEKEHKTSPKQQGNTMKTVPSGLKYEILVPAPENAATPTKGKPVTVHYTGWLADENGQPRHDKKFDSSIDRGQPLSFVLGVGQVIQGWDEGVSTMKVGEKRRLVIPPHLAYGSRGAGHLIPANATLVFDVELLKV